MVITTTDASGLTRFGGFTSRSAYKPMLDVWPVGVRTPPDYPALDRSGRVPARRHAGVTIVRSTIVSAGLARSRRLTSPCLMT